MTFTTCIEVTYFIVCRYFSAMKYMKTLHLDDVKWVRIWVTIGSGSGLLSPYWTSYSVTVPYISNTIELTRLIDGVGCFGDKVLAGQSWNALGLVSIYGQYRSLINHFTTTMMESFFTLSHQHLCDRYVGQYIWSPDKQRKKSKLSRTS